MELPKTLSKNDMSVFSTHEMSQELQQIPPRIPKTRGIFPVIPVPVLSKDLGKK